jgi:hypothetical protein
MNGKCEEKLILLLRLPSFFFFEQGNKGIVGSKDLRYQGRKVAVEIRKHEENMRHRVPIALHQEGRFHKWAEYLQSSTTVQLVTSARFSSAVRYIQVNSDSDGTKRRAVSVTTEACSAVSSSETGSPSF